MTWFIFTFDLIFRYNIIMMPGANNFIDAFFVDKTFGMAKK